MPYPPSKTECLHGAPACLPKKAKFPLEKIIFCDVDGTLIKQGKPNIKLVELLSKRKSEGFKIYLWSARGLHYATEAAETAGCKNLFEAILPKPSYTIDDNGWRWVRYTKKIRVP